MRVVGNALWLLLAGLWLGLGYAIAGLVCFLLVITIPFAIASWRLAGFTLWPFGRAVVPDPTAGAASVIGNVLWFLLAGLWLALGHLALGLVLCVTVIGIPFGLASFRMAGLALAPLGRRVVPRDRATAAAVAF